MQHQARGGWIERCFCTVAKTSRRLAGTFFRNLILIFAAPTYPAAFLVAFPSFLFAGGGFSQLPPRQMLKVTRQCEGNIIRILVQNLEEADVTATFELGLVNMKSKAQFPLPSTFPPHQTIEAFCLSPIREDMKWHYTLTNHYTLGNHRAVHDDSFVYRLPYAAGQGFSVSQAYNGTFSHTGAERCAIDWKMPEGTPVLAARAGVVVATKDDSEAGGPDKAFESSANYILIQHGDGTIGNYAHLQLRGVRVKVGQTVETGAVIGLSGNTGFSSGPHLHFSVFKAKDGTERESIPIRFRTADGAATTLLSGRTYLAPETLLVTTQNRTKRALN
jgi:murein DD-endopeptidase MepM/ murein hydrolase activator NlpD